VRWALSALRYPHLTPALSAPNGQRGRYRPTRMASRMATR
jgi:hypothetical protein